HVFRVTLRDPHPFPWIRVKVSAAIGQRLYPDPQWAQLDRLWEQLYPRREAPAQAQQVMAALEPAIPTLAHLLARHRPPLLGGVTLADAVRSPLRRPSQLMAWYARWRQQPNTYRSLPPTLFLAVLGQARLAGRLTPAEETAQVSRVLAYWAMRSTVD